MVKMFDTEGHLQRQEKSGREKKRPYVSPPPPSLPPLHLANEFEHGAIIVSRYHFMLSFFFFVFVCYCNCMQCFLFSSNVIISVFRVVCSSFIPSLLRFYWTPPPSSVPLWGLSGNINIELYGAGTPANTSLFVCCRDLIVCSK